MPLFQDPAYLRGQQYKTSSNLAARANLHRRFSTNPQGWLPWLFTQLASLLPARVLEVGGGPGWLWRENLAAVSAGTRILFTDLSMGMLREARHALASDARFTFAVQDAQALALPAASRDVVVANHMLYHVPDLPRAVRELARVLVPGGRLLTATNGLDHMAGLHHLLREFEPRFTGGPPSFAGTFTLENAAQRLAPAFGRVEIRRYPDALWVTEARPLVDYALSMSSSEGLLELERAIELEAMFQKRIDRDGGIRIGTSAGVALAAKSD